MIEINDRPTEFFNLSSSKDLTKKLKRKRINLYDVIVKRGFDLRERDGRKLIFQFRNRLNRIVIVVVVIVIEREKKKTIDGT